MIFETWAEKAKPENQTEMNRRYRSLSESLGVLLAPIGEVWSNVLSVGNIELYFRDGEHASAIGDFLIAMVLTKTITGKLPDGKFRTALDFTVPLEFQSVKEDASEEEIILGSEIVSLIRENIQNVFVNKA